VLIIDGHQQTDVFQREQGHMCECNYTGC